MPLKTSIILKSKQFPQRRQITIITQVISIAVQIDSPPYNPNQITILTQIHNHKTFLILLKVVIIVIIKNLITVWVIPS